MDGLGNTHTILVVDSLSFGMHDFIRMIDRFSFIYLHQTAAMDGVQVGRILTVNYCAYSSCSYDLTSLSH